MKRPPQPHLAPSRALLLATDRSRSSLAEATSGTVTRTAYSPYGSQRTDGVKQAHLGFNGELREPSYGWYHLGNGHRIYNPVLRRFHSPDRLSPFAEGGLNPYAYCVGDPINHTDPTGRAPQFQHLLALAVFGFSIVSGGAALFLPLVLKRAVAAAAAGAVPKSRVAQTILRSLVDYAKKKPAAATPLGGLEAASVVLSTASAPMGIVGTVQAMQEDPAVIDNGLMIAAGMLSLFTVAVKGLVVPLTPKLMTSKWGGRMAKFVHGKGKVDSAKKELVGARLYSQHPGGAMPNGMVPPPQLPPSGLRVPRPTDAPPPPPRGVNVRRPSIEETRL